MKYFLVLFVMCFSVYAEWYQQYQEIRDRRAHNYAQDALSFAIKKYGEPDFKLGFFYLYQSKRSKSPYLLSSADICDLKSFQKLIGSKDFVLKGLITFKQNTDLYSQIDELNKIIDGQVISERVKTWTLNKEERRLAGEGFFSWFSKDEKLLNRRIVERAFSGSIRKYVKRKKVRAGLQLCEFMDEERGDMVIYLVRSAKEKGFYDELGHEVFHLLNPKFNDWFMEGWASVFSEDFARRQGKKWRVWKELFESEPESLYAQSYFMVKKAKSLGMDFSSLRKFSKKTDEGEYYLDLLAWVNSHDESVKEQAYELLSSYKKVFEDTDKIFVLE